MYKNLKGIVRIIEDIFDHDQIILILCTTGMACAPAIDTPLGSKWNHSTFPARSYRWDGGYPQIHNLLKGFIFGEGCHSLDDHHENQKNGCTNQNYEGHNSHEAPYHYTHTDKWLSIFWFYF